MALEIVSRLALLFVTPAEFIVYAPRPPSVKAPAVLLNVIEPTVRLVADCGASRVLPAKTNRSPVAGACAGLQLAALLTLLSLARPVHVSVAPETLHEATRRKTRTAQDARRTRFFG